MANGGRALTRELHTEYDMRHCDMERGSAASSGWWMPGWGASNLLVGAFMVPYDQDATPEFMRVAGPAYGSYVANSIVETISQEVTASGSADRSLSTCLRFEGTTGTPVASCRIRS